MRQLKPQVIEQRKKALLQWVIHYYIRTSKPVASSIIAEEAGLDLSSATIRNVLQELEEEGFLHQPHTSSGRQPTDKGYRFYVDYLMDVQRLASDEKARIERQYKNSIEEMDTLLAETSKLLSRVSKGAGLVLSPQVRSHTLKRLEIVHLGGHNVLGILVTSAGMVRHWPIRLAYVPTARQISFLNRFLNESIKGCSVSEAQATIMAKLREMESEFQGLNSLAGQLITEIGQIVAPELLYVDGTDSLISQAEEMGDLHAVQSLMKVIDEKRALSELLESHLAEPVKGARTARVSIGKESGIPELGDLSLVTTTFKHKDRLMGVLGVLGSKRMEYSRMMSLVDYMSDIVSRKLESWDGEDAE